MLSMYASDRRDENFFFVWKAEDEEETQNAKEKGDKKSVGSNTNGHRRYRLL